MTIAPTRFSPLHSCALILLVVVASGFSLATWSASPSDEARVTVDFAQRIRGVRSMSGFLHGSDADQPPDSAIRPLKPALWRIGFAWRDNRDRLAKMGVPTVMVLSDLWDYAKTPITDFPTFEKKVREIAREAKGRGLVWDIWNEPDIKQFWKGDEAQSLEAFAHGAAALRAELGSDTLISGPSIARYDADRIARFLDYCRGNRIRVDVLSWHELAVDANIPSIEDHLRDAQTRFMQNPAYAAVGIKKIQINEIIGPTAQYRPGEILGYLKYCEAGGADGACKACWNDSKGESNCANNTLDGILTPDRHLPRAAWWAYKAYADTVAGRVESSSDDERLVSFAAAQAGTRSVQIVIGCFSLSGASSAAPTKLTLDLRGLSSLPYLRGRKNLTVKVEKIPDAGEAVVAALATVQETTASVSADSASLTIPAPAEHEGLVVTITATRDK